MKGKMRAAMGRIWSLVLGAALLSGIPAAAVSEVGETALCGTEEHTHREECYGAERVLVCCLPEVTAHIHGEDCYIPGEGHSHDEGCYDETGAPICGREESEAVSILICPRAETIPHRHEPECFDEMENPVCGLEEIEEHTHEDGCYETKTTVLCNLAEHTHDAACFDARMPAISLLESVTVPPEAAVEGEAAAAGDSAAEAAAAGYTAAARGDDIATVSGDGIRFRLFNYSLNINKTQDGTAWRTLSGYFAFRDSKRAVGTAPGTDIHIPDPNINPTHDADGFTAAHATVERVLDGNGYPVLDLTRNADGTARSDPGVGAGTRNLAYLFGGGGDHAVSVYAPSNTILQKNGSRYWYESAQNAVDYDAGAGVFRLRSYAERNSTTAGYGGSYGDFMPFTYTDGQIVGSAEDGTAYHVQSSDTDYWFGMTMEVDFFQTKGGLVDGEDMIFRFSGDDDVWVFVDDVLVLDLGGTHGTVDGSINFATGEVRQYLSWGGANAAEEARQEGSSTSFPTTIRACFDAAGRTPNGGWSESGETFAGYSKHTLTFFYLERGAAVANCSLDFRLPTLPDKSLTVTKALETDGDATGAYIEESLSYAFRVIRADSGELFLPAGTEYDLLSEGVKIGSATVDEEGLFYLRAGQSAQFTDMLTKGGGAVEYVVQEIMPDALTGQYGGVEYEVSGAGGETVTEEGPTEAFTAFETGYLSAEETQAVTYRNRVDTSRLCRLEITKTADEGTVIGPRESFSVQVRLGGELLPIGTAYTVAGEERTVSEEGILSLRVGETAVLTAGILSGTTYEIKELPVAGYEAAYRAAVTAVGETTDVPVSANVVSGEFPLGSTVSVTVVNHSYELPHTGGTGTWKYTVGGQLLMAAGIALLYNRSRRRREDAPGTEG